MALTMADVEVSWRQTVTRFVEDSPWLTDEHLPQLKALLAIADILDRGGRVQAALVSQFTLTQRTLAAKAPGSEEGGRPATGDSNPPSLLDGLLDGEWNPAA